MAWTKEAKPEYITPGVYLLTPDYNYVLVGESEDKVLTISYDDSIWASTAKTAASWDLTAKTVTSWDKTPKPAL